MLFDGEGSPCEESLVDERLLASSSRQSPGTTSPALLHHVPWDKLIDGDFTPDPFAEHSRSEFNRAAKRLNGVLGTALLDDVKHHAQ